MYIKLHKNIFVYVLMLQKEDNDGRKKEDEIMINYQKPTTIKNNIIKKYDKSLWLWRKK